MLAAIFIITYVRISSIGVISGSFTRSGYVLSSSISALTVLLLIAVLLAVA